MQIHFDPRDRNSASAVLAVIFALHGELPEIELANAVFEEAPDAARAFEGGTSADQAFVAPPAIPPAAEPVVPPAAAVPPPPVPAPPAAAVPATPAADIDLSRPAGPDGPQLDKSGLPHDPRIHSKPPAINKKGGLWRQKRGVDEATVTAVTAELRQAMAAPPPGPPPPMFTDHTDQPGEHPGVPPVAVPLPPAAAPAAVPPPPAPADTGNGGNDPAGTAPAAAGVAAASETAPPAAAVPPPPVPAPPAAAAPAAPAVPAAPAGQVATFADLMRKITGMQTAGTLTVAGTQEISTSLGLSGVRDLMHRPDLIPAFDQLLPVTAA